MASKIKQFFTYVIVGVVFFLSTSICNMLPQNPQNPQNQRKSVATAEMWRFYHATFKAKKIKGIDGKNHRMKFYDDENSYWTSMYSPKIGAYREIRENDTIEKLGLDSFILISDGERFLFLSD
jgi:hypothetical protein